MRPRYALLALGFVVMLWARSAQAQVPLLGGFGGPAGYGANVLPANDDGSTGMLDLTGAFPGGLRFFGGPYMTFWVNNNGNITFSGPVFNYTPMPFPIAARPMIAPYWGDVDTRGGSTAGDNLVYWHIEPGRLIVTWHNVGYYGSHIDHRMDFQLIITNTLDCGSGDFDVQFRYHVCGWTTGDASGGSGGFGGTPAQAGFDAGNTVDFVEIPGSRTAAILDVCTTSNLGLPGIWEFSVRGGSVVCPDSGTPCDVSGAVGACAIGRTQCVGRDVQCQPIGASSAERCDGVDNDCDGTVDNGMGLCSATEVCSQGRCVPICFEGGCIEGYTCDPSGTCIETACVGVTCGVDERCEGGTCVGACDGIVCPHGQECVSGRCSNPCDVVTCGMGQVCEAGLCVPTCPCRPCPGGGTCGADGSCTPRDCDIVLCDPGFYCEASSCHDACEGAVCPTGQRCEVGECVDIPPPPRPDAGPPPDPDAGAGVDSGTPDIDAGPPSAPDAGRHAPPPADTGCGCRTERGAPLPMWGFVIFAVLGLVVARRRRR